MKKLVSIFLIAFSACVLVSCSQESAKEKEQKEVHEKMGKGLKSLKTDRSRSKGY